MRGSCVLRQLLSSRPDTRPDTGKQIIQPMYISIDGTKSSARVSAHYDNNWTVVVSSMKLLQEKLTNWHPYTTQSISSITTYTYIYLYLLLSSYLSLYCNNYSVNKWFNCERVEFLIQGLKSIEGRRVLLKNIIYSNKNVGITKIHIVHKWH